MIEPYATCRTLQLHVHLLVTKVLLFFSFFFLSFFFLFFFVLSSGFGGRGSVFEVSSPPLSKRGNFGRLKRGVSIIRVLAVLYRSFQSFVPPPEWR